MAEVGAEQSLMEIQTKRRPSILKTEAKKLFNEQQAQAGYFSERRAAKPFQLPEIEVSD